MSEIGSRSWIIISLALCLLFLMGPLMVAFVNYPATLAMNNSSASRGSGIIMSPLVIPLGRDSSDQPTCSTGLLCPSMMTTAYGFSTLFNSDVNGSAQTVVIEDACGDPNITTDLNAFDSYFGLPNATLNILTPQGTPCSDSGWAFETALDVEWSHVVAPGATIDLLLTLNAGAQSMYYGWSYALKHDLGNQISNSWTGAGCGILPCNNTIGEGIGPCNLTNGTQGVNVSHILKQAGKQNVTILVGSGDGGWWGLGTGNEEPVPSDCKGVLTVGGTYLNVTGTGGYLGETGWGGSGGGYVTSPKEPSYQRKADITDPYRTLAKPDVAADASCSSAVWIVFEGSWAGVCGTSLATPLWAGFMADVNQIRASNHFFPAGYVNPFLYTTIYRNSTLYSSDFNDITTGSNGWSAGNGWDPVTGLGSFIAPNLAETLGNNENA